MAEQTISLNTSHGLYNSEIVNPGMLNTNAKTADFRADLSESKDSIIAIVDIPATLGGSFELRIKSCDGTADKVIKFQNEDRYIARFTTMGIKDKDGFAHFTFVADSDANISDIRPLIYLISCIDVVNH